MLQYIINSTCIWLLGLLIFDLLLRNEAQHNYNRLYLLSILFAGALIPFWSWDVDSVIYATNVSAPIAEQTATVKESIVNASQSTVIEWQQWLIIIYSCGVAFFFLLFAKDILNIIRLYRLGEKSKDGTWTIIETGKNQSPFSAFRYVFISSKANYSNSELQMILAHEEQHGHLLHFVDVLLTRIAAIIFWFNPLIYMLEQRLLMVHEYQADVAVKDNSATYGQFLIEQSILGSAPVLAHSFIRSPLKKRILMLTKKTTAIARGKQIFIIPVLLLSMLCFTQNAFSWGTHQRDGNKVTYRGNTIEYSEEGAPDTMQVQNAETKEYTIVITRRSAIPVKLNGEKIYTAEELQYEQNGRYKKKSALNDQALKEYLLHNMAKEIKKLDDGKYRLSVSDVVINEEGLVVYFEFDGLYKILKTDGVRNNIAEMPEKQQKLFAQKVATLINSAPKHEPAIYEGTKVNSLMGSNYALLQPFTVKDGKLVAL